MTKSIQVALHCVPVPRLWVCSRCARGLADVLGWRARYFWENSCPRCKTPGCGMALVTATEDEIKAARAAQETSK